MKTIRFNYLIKLLVIFSFSLISCENENEKICDLVELPLEIDDNNSSPDDGLAIDIDRDCVNDIVIFSSHYHALGAAMTDNEAKIGTLRSDIKIATYENADSTYQVEYIDFIEDSANWIDGLYDTVYVFKSGTELIKLCESCPTNITFKNYPKCFDNIESIISSNSNWISDTLVLSSYYKSTFFNPYNGQYKLDQNLYIYGPWDYVDYNDDEVKKHIGISIKKGNDITYFGIELSVRYSLRTTVFQIEKIN